MNASVDMFMASSIMILLILASFYGVTEVSEIYWGRSPEGLLERGREVGRYLLLSPGEPADWGVETSGAPTHLGLAEEGSDRPYKLNIDKVSRLRSGGRYALTYSQLWEALGVKDLSFRIELETLFDVSLSLSSTEDLGSETRYTFQIHTSMGGLPLSVDVKWYALVRDYIASGSSSTDGGGEGTVSLTLPNSLSGSALLVVLARTESDLLSFGVLQFGHRAQEPRPNGSYLTLTPLNYTLYVDANYPGESLIGARVLTYHYEFNLTAEEEGTYAIPRLLDPSPMVLVVTGVNGTDYFAEWISYPPVPLEVGAGMEPNYLVSEVSSAEYLVEVAGVLYRVRISVRRPET
ncbi:hypothetical protein J7L60_00290 [Candidatus Bathyarchaeota archaeon]|nr:hypothetical protein [Candidatus Bathyarchaeota archaeon]